jgi:hypothetical protein
MTSPFRWKEEVRLSIFANDPHFRSRQKAGLIDDDQGLKYKQFGTKHVTNEPMPMNIFFNNQEGKK